MFLRSSESRYLLLILAIVSVATQFAFLSYPREVIFDEVHFGKFITSYCCTGERIFDIHPPHGKLVIAAAAKLGGYNGLFPFKNISDKYGDVPVFALRFVPALAGVILPVIVFVLLRQLGAGDATAFLGGLAITLDNAFTVQSRIIALDGMLLVGVFGALSLFLAGMQNVEIRRHREVAQSDRGDLILRDCFGSQEPRNDKQRRERAKESLLLFAGAGALAGFAAGVKLTGLAALMVIGIIILGQMVVELWKTHHLRITDYGLWITTIVVTAAVVYIAGWYLHFSILTNPGSGDAWGVPTGYFWEDMITLQKKMLDANYGLTATHPYSSVWWNWPIMKRPIFYWQGTEVAGLRGMIYYIGNPVVWWGGSALFLVALASSVYQIFNSWLIRRGTLIALEKEKRKQKIEKGEMKIVAGSVFGFPFSVFLIPLTGFLVSYLPFIRIPRALFMYHYMMPLIFSLLFALVWLDVQYKASVERRGKAPVWYFASIAAIVIGFVLFSPLTYGFPAGDWQTWLFWFSTWR